MNLLHHIIDRIYIGYLPEIGSTALTGVGLFTHILMHITAFAVFLAEPVSDRIAAALTTFMFFRFFLRMLKEGKAAQQ